MQLKLDGMLVRIPKEFMRAGILKAVTILIAAGDYVGGLKDAPASNANRSSVIQIGK